MTVVAIECKHCGGTLPSPADGSPFVSCPYCGTSHAVTAPAMALAPEVQGPSEYELRVAAAKKAWETTRASSTDPVLALRAMVAALGQRLDRERELERAARLAEALGTGFDQANGTHSISDQDAALRLAEGAVKAVIELRSCPDTTVHLPFLTTGASGPVHLDHRVTRATLGELDTMGVYVVKEAPAPVPAPARAPEVVAPKAKGWWPFR
jgi:uncharacterized Zn finger protein (UPF0148 family)